MLATPSSSTSVFVGLYLAGGIESFRASPRHLRRGADHAQYTHSLLGAVLLSALYGGLAGLAVGP